MSGSVYENKRVEILKNDWKLSKCCKENEYFIRKRSKGELHCYCGELNWTLKMMGKLRSYQVRPEHR